MVLFLLLLPRTTGALRIYAISLILTAPFSVVGLSVILKWFNLDNKKQLVAFSIFLLAFLSFSTGIVANAINFATGDIVDFSICFPTDIKKIQESNNLECKWLVYWTYRPDSTIEATLWLLKYHNPNKEVYMDSLLLDKPITPLGEEQIFPFLSAKYGGKMIFKDMKPPHIECIRDVLEKKGFNGYVFLGWHNIADDLIILISKNEKEFLKTSNYSAIFETNGSRIYDCGEGGAIYVQ